jgi:undecaprenyl phosphate-alpha-L-ara4N flippase subunit ArnE
MRLPDVLLCLVCVALVSLGQVLLRGVSIAAADGGIARLLSLQSGVAVAVYGLAMLMWLFVLSRVPLTQAFAFFGLCFFLVPLLAHQFHGDPIGPRTWLGAAIIAVGVIVTTAPRA